jgi:dipeptidyl aminopeptidase/acylaminoacyl peptidase
MPPVFWRLRVTDPIAALLRRLMLVLVLPILTFSAPVSAIRLVEPGEVVELKPDEGLLAVSFDTLNEVKSVRFGRRGGVFATGLLKDLGVGRSLQLFALDAGDYQWSEVSVRTIFGLRWRFDVSDDDELAFNVEPGRINYAGDLVFRMQSNLRADIYAVNRSLRVIDWLDKQHPDLRRRYGFAFSSEYPDPFPDFYASEKEHWGAVGDKASPLPPELKREPDLSVDALWSDTRVLAANLNDRGDLIAMLLRAPDGSLGLDLIDPISGHAQRLDSSPGSITEIGWKDDRTLIAQVFRDGEAWFSVYEIGESVADERAVKTRSTDVQGSVIDLLPADPDHVLHQGRDLHGQLVVFRVDIRSDAGLKAFRKARTRDRLNRGVEDDLHWLTDGTGRLRAAATVRDEQLVLMHGSGREFREVLRFTGKDDFEPMALSADGELIYGLSDAGRGQRDLVAFSAQDGRITETVFSRPGVDVLRPLMDRQRRPIGAVYYEAGIQVSEYFDADEQREAQRLASTFPGRTVLEIDRSADQQRRLLWVDGHDSPPRLYFLDLVARRAELLEEAFPRLAGQRFAPSHRVLTETQDRHPLESFLTLPEGEGLRPLVLMPHGGPIGVSDRLHFEPEVQFLAGLGYAVLRVNFRGSDGYGRQFREAGHQQAGAGIEDDIGRALEAALQNHPLDPERICVLGASYGGYSALASALRWPGRFRCAVSIAGVSDFFLAFSASDSSRHTTTRELITRLFGDPRSEGERFLRISPLYHYRELDLPILLVHGQEDRRVDQENTLRLQRMLSLAGRPPSLLLFGNEGHALADKSTVNALWPGIAAFLDAHLRPEEAPAQDLQP